MRTGRPENQNEDEQNTVRKRKEGTHVRMVVREMRQDHCKEESRAKLDTNVTTQEEANVCRKKARQCNAGPVNATPRNEEKREANQSNGIKRNDGERCVGEKRKQNRLDAGVKCSFHVVRRRQGAGCGNVGVNA
jgi:hypothetical protein